MFFRVRLVGQWLCSPILAVECQQSCFADDRQFEVLEGKVSLVSEGMFRECHKRICESNRMYASGLVQQSVSVKPSSNHTTKVKSKNGCM